MVELSKLKRRHAVGVGPPQERHRQVAHSHVLHTMCTVRVGKGHTPDAEKHGCRHCSTSPVGDGPGTPRTGAHKPPNQAVLTGKETFGSHLQRSTACGHTSDSHLITPDLLEAGVTIGVHEDSATERLITEVI